MPTIDALAKAALDGRTPSPVDPNVERLWPFLWELLTKDAYTDGTLRILPEIKIIRAPGGYQAQLNDHETCKQWAVAFLTLGEVFEALETRLCSGGPPRDFKSMVNRSRGPFSLKRKKG